MNTDKPALTEDLDRTVFESVMRKHGFKNPERINHAYRSVEFQIAWEMWNEAKAHERLIMKESDALLAEDAKVEKIEHTDEGQTEQGKQGYSLDRAGDAFIAFGEALNDPNTTIDDLSTKAYQCGCEFKFILS